MYSSVARMLYDSLKEGDPLDAEWFWEAGTASARNGTPLDIVIWNAVREILESKGHDFSSRAEDRMVAQRL